MHDSVNAHGPLPRWLCIAALLGEYDAHCTVEDDKVTAIDSFGKAHVLSITITPSNVDEILAMLESFDPSRDKNGAPASHFIRRDFTYFVLEPPHFDRRLIRIRRWRRNASWTLTA